MELRWPQTTASDECYTSRVERSAIITLSSMAMEPMAAGGSSSRAGKIRRYGQRSSHALQRA